MNEWNDMASKARTIQDAKNRVLNGKLHALVEHYAPEGGVAFDYGCGWGEFADSLSSKGFAVEAYDDADEMVKEAKARFQVPRFFTKVEFQTRLPSLHKKYDMIVSNLVLCILSKEEQSRMLHTIKAIAKDDAPLIISFCHPCTDYLTVGVVSKRLRPHTWNPRYDKEFKYRKVVHENKIEFSDYHRPLSYYAKLFEEHELRIVDIKESDVLGTEAHPDFITFVLKSD